MKTCFKCNRTKQLDMFYPHKQMSDGRLNKCKECNKKDSHERFLLKSNDLGWVEKEADRHRIKAEKYRKEGRGYDPETTRRIKADWAKKNKHKRNAHNQVTKAVKSGKLLRQPCEVCGEIKAQAHHDDYTKPLDVRWLCVPHHNKHHVNMRRIERAKKLQPKPMLKFEVVNNQFQLAI